MTTYSNPDLKPTGKVSTMTASRTKDTRTIVAKWKVPSVLTSTKDDAGRKRTEYLLTGWVVDRFRPNGKDPANIKVDGGRRSVSTTQYSLNLNSFSTGGKSPKTYGRSSFYPVTTSMVASVTCKVWCWNRKGTASSPAGATYKFAKPGKPTVSALTQDHDTGNIQFTITAFDGSKGPQERYDTRYQIEKFDSRWKTKKAKVISTGTFTESKKEWTTQVDAEGRMELGYNDYIRYRVRAMSRGLAGMSDGLAVGKSNEGKAWTAWRQLVVAYPGLPTIKKVTLSNTKSTSKVTVAISTNNDKDRHPVTGVRLERLVNTTAKTAAQAVAADGWESTDVIDDGQCTALGTTVAELTGGLENGNRVWVRVKSWNQFEDLFYRYSQPVEVKELFQEADSAADDECSILSASPDVDGTTVVVVVGYDKKDGSARDDATGTEVSWSTYKDAWTSTDPPETFDVTWKTATSAQEYFLYRNDWYYCQTVRIRNLTEGTPIFIRARRFREEAEDDERTFGRYCVQRTATPFSVPDSVVVTAPRYVSEGGDIALSWTYDCDSPQREWQVVTGATTTRTETLEDGTTRKYKVIADKKTVPMTIIASGTGSTSSTVISSSWLNEHPDVLDDTGSMPIGVRVSTGGSMVDSEAVMVSIATPPTLSLTVPATMTEQPLSIEAESGVPANLSVVVRAAGSGVYGSGPAGDMVQPAGDVVWQSLETPQWSEVSIQDESNLITNLPENWFMLTNHVQIGDTLVADIPHVRVSVGNMVAVEQSTSYTVSLSGPGASGVTDDGDSYRWGIAGIFGVNEGGSVVSGRYFEQYGSSVSYDAGVTSATWNTGDAVSAYVMLARSIEFGGETTPWLTPDACDLIGTDVLVKFEEGSTATSWTPHPQDLSSIEATLVTPITPTVLNLIDGGEYEVAVRAIDPDTGLASEEVTETFAVAWAHQAPAPAEPTITPYDVTDDAGVRMRGCSIQLAEPDGAADSDVYDLYRVTPDGPYLIAEGVAMDSLVDDPYAPYGGTEKGYRVATRTSDGDVDWSDFQYEMPGKDIRIDFGSEYVELPYNVSISDGYQKDFEVRRKMSGDMDGYWNDGVERHGGFSSDLIRIQEEEKAKTVRHLARHVGPCFVRTPDGCAYAADVEVSSIGGARLSAALAVSIDATEVGLTRDFWATVDEEG